MQNEHYELNKSLIY